MNEVKTMKKWKKLKGFKGETDEKFWIYSNHNQKGLKNKTREKLEIVREKKVDKMDRKSKAK